MDSLPPPWFDGDCNASFPAGIQLVAIEREADGEQIMGRVRIDAAGIAWLSASDYLTWTGLSELPKQVETTAAGTWYALTSIPYRLDACAMRLQLAAQLPRRHYQNSVSAGAEQLPNELGGYLNVDAFAYQSQGMPAGIAAQTEVGVSAAGALWRTRQVFLREGSRRLDSQVRWDAPRTMTSIEIGDILNSGLSMSPNVRFGGLSWGSDFSQRPELPTYPLASLRGEATLPSSAELYIDGQLRQSNRLAAGPYALDAQSAINGAGDLQVIVRDNLGRETLISQAFYTSPKLLRAGLSDYHIDIGRLREGFGSDDDQYTAGFISGRWRQGTEQIGTLGIRADLLNSSQSTQGEWLYSDPRWGLLQVGLGTSLDRRQGWGQHINAGYEWLSRRGSFQLQASASSPEFVELGREIGAIARSLRAQTGWHINPASSITLGWSDEQRRDRENLRIATASWNYSLSADRQVYLSLIHSPGLGLNSSVGLTQNLSKSWQLSSQLTQRGEDGSGIQFNLSWQPESSVWSGRLASETRAHEQVSQANALYTGDRGQASFGIGDRNGVTSLQGSMTSALAWVPGNVFWSKRVQQGFIVVDAGVADAMVYRNNQPSGKTDAQGQRLLTDVWPYQSTSFRLGWEDLPLSAQLGEMEAILRPPRGIGHVRLANASRHHSTAWQARLSTGEWLPAGSTLVYQGQWAELPSGLDGLLYLPSHWQGGALEAILPDQRHCHIAALPEQPSLGELTCELVQ